MKKITCIKTVLVVFLMFITSCSLYAQLAVPFTPRLQGGSIKVKGDVILIGNSVVTGEGLPQPYNGTQNNNTTTGIYINVASGGDPSIFSSSSANLDIETFCKKILFAGLYWASAYPVEIATNRNAFFEGTPRFEDWNQIKFRLPTGGFIDLEADNAPDPVGEEDDIIFDGFGYYGPGVENSFRDSPIICYKNVTNLLQGLPDANGEYTVANLRATRGDRAGGCSAGWTLVVIYESPLLPSKFISVFDGYGGVGGGTEIDIPVSDFQTLPAPLPVNANIGVAALDGDIGITGDIIEFRASTVPTFTVMSDLINQADNFFNSTITSNGVHVTNRNPSNLNTLGLDINNLRIPNQGNSVLPNNATAGELRLTTSGDGYGAFLAFFSVEIIEQNPVLRFADEVVTCVNDGKQLPKFFLCEANNSRLIQTGISDTNSMLWERLDETSCPAVTNLDCVNEDISCTWEQVGTGPDYNIDSQGQYRLTLNYTGDCFNHYYFNVYENLLLSAAALVTNSGNEASGIIQIVPAGGQPPYEYYLPEISPLPQASNIFYNLPSGFYTASVIDALGCSYEFPVNVLEVNIDNTVLVIGNRLTPNLEAISYQWINANTETPIEGATERTFIAEELGSYRVEMTAIAPDALGKSQNNKNNAILPEVITVSSPVYEVTTLASNKSILPSINIYPNPVISYITLPVDILINKRYTIYDILGHQVDSGTILNQTLSVEKLSKGLYFFSVDGYRVFKFVKN